MAVSMEDVRAALDPEEPDYEAASLLGEGAVPHLRELVEGDDPMLASKAAYLAGLIGGDEAGEVVIAAAHSADPVIRVAAASSTGHLPDHVTEEVLIDLVADDDAGVRKVALKAIPSERSAQLEEVLKRARRDAGGASG